MSEPLPDDRTLRPRRRWRRALVGAALGLLLALAGSEAALRFLLFHPGELAQRLGKNLRRIESFGDLQSDEEVWKLQWAFSDRAGAKPNDHPDPLVGWRGALLPGFLHPQGQDLERTLRGRRLVLLFGDSYAQCNTPPNLCFQRLLQESDLGSRFLLLNCGVGGYGLDQIHLLIRNVVPNYAKYSPIVVLSVFADDDLDRTALGFRCWPKPRLELRDGVLDYGAPVETDVETYLARHPVRITSYLHRLLGWRQGLLPHRLQRWIRVDDQRIEEKRALSRAILDATAADLRGLGLEYFVLVFQGEVLLNLRGKQWQEELLEQFARDEGVGLISTEPFLLAASGGNAEVALRLFGGTPQLAGHYNAEGNRVAFEALRQGLLGRFDPLDTSAVARGEAEARTVDVGTFRRPARLLGRPCTIVWRDEEDCVLLGLPQARSHTEEGTFSARAGRRGATSIVWKVGETQSTWHARARVADGAAARFAFVIDGGEPSEHALGGERSQEQLAIAVAGARELELRLEPVGDSAPAWVVFEEARLE